MLSEVSIYHVVLSLVILLGVIGIIRTLSHIVSVTRMRRIEIFIPFITPEEIGSAWNSIVTKLGKEKDISLDAYCPSLIECWDQNMHYPRIVATHGHKKNPTTLVLTGELPDAFDRYSIQGYLRHTSKSEIHPAFIEILELGQLKPNTREGTTT